MSTIEAIGIAGFRSYSPSSLQKIEFSKPLTLIWGSNGAGKTTIIEAMKYIMAGILPPSCERGKNFLIDPRIVGASEVNGEIRLRFRSYTGRAVMAVKRSLFSMTNRGNKFESTEQILKTKDQNGNQIQINHHCAQIQKQIPFLLGTSKAIIDKVMFCHQEESLWPFQESCILKTIFDQLFETKKYTQMIETLWEQRKGLQKTIGELKKALPYQQRLYVEDKKRKGAALRQMEQARKQIKEELLPIKQQLQAMMAELNSDRLNVTTEERIKLAAQQTLLQERVRLNKSPRQTIVQRLQVLSTQYEQLTGTNLIFDKDQIQEYNRYNSENKINELKKQRQQLSKILQNFKNNQKISQKESDLQKLIKQAKQFLPQITRQANLTITDDFVFKRLLQKKQQMENKIKKIKLLEVQKDKCYGLNINFGQKRMSKQDYQQQKRRLVSDKNIFNELKLKILGYYFALYKPIDPKASASSKQDNVADRLQEVTTRIKIKKEELQRYKNIPQEMPLNKRIDRIKYTCIELYENYLQYCNQKKKCSFCSKPMNEQEMMKVKAKCQKLKQRSEKQLKELQQQQLRELICNHVDGDPGLMIPKLQDQINKLEKQQKILSQRMKRYEASIKSRQQRKINEKLYEGICLVKFDREVQKGSAEIYEKYAKEASIEQFYVLTRQYLDMSNQIPRIQRNIEIYQSQQLQNKKKQIQKENAQLRIKNINDEITNLQLQTKNYQIIARIVNKFATLLKQKQTFSRFKGEEGNNQNININTKQLTQRIDQINKQIKIIELLTEFYTNNCQLEQLKTQYNFLISQIKNNQFQIKEIQKLLNEKQRKQKEYYSLKEKFDKKANSLHIKADIAFDEYKRLKSEKEYLLMKSKLEDAEKASRDIETYCKVVEKTISQIHKQKMDEINKIISDIWRQVYHQNDITCIQIETLINEDAKRRKSYYYSIVMYKNGPQIIKLEMRGRCSMGQKVLASLVIRMALAEVFASSARFLALDQPTTNLDQVHIDNLAKELIKIIQMNEGGNFQMVIITHDMELIKKLERFTNHYYEISRIDNKFSSITRKEIGELYKKF